MNGFNNNTEDANASAAAPWQVDDNRGGRQLSLPEVRELYVGSRYNSFADAFDAFDETDGTRISFSDRKSTRLNSSH